MRAQHPTVAGDFKVAAEQDVAQPDQRVEPVRAQQKKTKRFDDMIAAPDMRALMGEHIDPVRIGKR